MERADRSFGEQDLEHIRFISNIDCSTGGRRWTCRCGFLFSIFYLDILLHSGTGGISEKRLRGVIREPSASLSFITNTIDRIRYATLDGNGFASEYNERLR